MLSTAVYFNFRGGSSVPQFHVFGADLNIIDSLWIYRMNRALWQKQVEGDRAGLDAVTHPVGMKWV